MIKFPENLVKKLQQNNIVIFVGAGLSVNVGYPSWNTLIQVILDGLSTKEAKSEKYKRALIEDLFTPVEVLKKI